MNYGIGNVKEKDKSKSLFTTTTAPTESGDVITLATTDIIESGFKVGDYLAYVDSGNISALYSISAISSGTATLSLIGNIGGGGGGKQLYQHNIHFRYDGVCKFTITLILEDDTPIITYSALKNTLTSLGFFSNSKYLIVNYGLCDNSGDKTIYRITNMSSAITFGTYSGYSGGGSFQTPSINDAYVLCEDSVIEL